jgi:hypothetical protein
MRRSGNPTCVAGNGRRVLRFREIESAVPDFVSRHGSAVSCKSPVFRLYYQENTGAHACRSAPSALFFVQPIA